MICLNVTGAVQSVDRNVVDRKDIKVNINVQNVIYHGNLKNRL